MKSDVTSGFRSILLRMVLIIELRQLIRPYHCRSQCTAIATHGLPACQEEGFTASHSIKKINKSEAPGPSRVCKQ